MVFALLLLLCTLGISALKFSSATNPGPGEIKNQKLRGGDSSLHL